MIETERDLAALLVAHEILDRHKLIYPGDYYDPHAGGQLQFHGSKHIIRGLFPGNGWGKTTGAACEADAWLRHTNRWQETPAWPCIVIWFCQDFRQFELLRAQIEDEAIGPTPVWVEKYNYYRYPDGGRFYVISCDRKWTFLQGINPDLVIFDEQPPLSLWREMLMRRRGRRKTRFIVAATATQGITWMSDEIFKPWVDHHAARGISEEGRLEIQSHPDLFVWDRGGIDDNPGADESDKVWYHSRTWSSEKEKQVRLYGGFQDWTGDAVFDELAMSWLRDNLESWKKANPKATVSGTLVPIYSTRPGETR